MQRAILIRHYRTGEHVVLATVFTRAVHELARGDYTPAQLSAWAPRPPDLQWWLGRCELKRPLVALDASGAVAGFLELDPDGHVDCTYVNPDFARCGVMTQLMDRAEGVCRSIGLTRMYAEVSRTALPFFAGRGWVNLGDNIVSRQGVELVNAKMEKSLPRP